MITRLLLRSTSGILSSTRVMYNLAAVASSRCSTGDQLKLCRRPEAATDLHPKMIRHLNSRAIHRGKPMDKLTAAAAAHVDERDNGTDTTNFRESRLATQRIKSMLSASGIVDMCPSSVQPYLRLIRVHEPIGSWLVFWPCAWSIGLAANAGSLPDLYLMGLFATGAVVLRGAGCIVNDMWDSKIDAKVERTRNRPIASGAITTADAVGLLAIMCTFGDLLLMQLNTYCFLLGGFATFLIFLYPLMKRIINWPQLFLGLTFNWGALMGWTAVHNSCDLNVCLPLYAGCVAWTLIYDTIYAHQDKKYDLAIGVKSTALLFGSKTKTSLMCFTSVMSTAFVTAGIATAQTLPYYVSIGLATTHVVHQIWTLDIDNPKDCNNKFKSNYLLGFIIMAGIIGSALMKRSKKQDEASSTPATTAAATHNSRIQTETTSEVIVPVI